MFNLRKRSPAVVAMAGLLQLAAGPVVAQGNVVLYGRIAGGVDYVSKVATGGGKDAALSRYANSQWGTSLWGLRGREELGGGLSAVFNLESAFATGTGSTGGAPWGRYSVVGLSSRRYGTVLLGRAMALPDGEVYAIDPMGMQATSASTLHNNRAWGPRPRVVTYNSPELGAFSFRAQAALPCNDPGTSTGRLLAGVASYTAGPLMLKGLYEEIRDTHGELSSLYRASRLYVAGGSYRAGDATILGGYSIIRSGSGTVTDLDNPAASTRQHTGWLGINYRATPGLSMIGGIYRANRNRGGGGATLAAVGANYSLSPATMIYGTAGTVENSVHAAFSSELGGGRPLPGAGQRNVYAGLLHWF